jgi:pyridoxine kinase
MGDDGKLYVSAEVVPMYKSLLPFSDIITPNWFEAEVLTDIKIIDGNSLKKVLRKLIEMGCKGVIISSLSLPQTYLSSLLPPESFSSTNCSNQMLVTAVITRESLEANFFHLIPFPSLPETFVGVGDLFSALVTAHSHPSDGKSLEEIAVLAVGTMQDVLENTREEAVRRKERDGGETVEPSGGVESQEEIVKRSRNVELRLVQSWKEIVEHKVRFKAIRVELDEGGL